MMPERREALGATMENDDSTTPAQRAADP